MRVLLVTLFAAAAVVTPSLAAAPPKPFALVLHQGDVPRTYRFDRDNSLGPFDRPIGEPGAATRALQRAGLRGGFIARYTETTGGWSYINSIAFVFARPSGALSYYAWLVRNVLEQQSHPARRATLQLGDTAHLYDYGRAEPGTTVVQRHGSVVAMLSCYRTPRRAALARSLARAQERRIAAAVD